MQVKYSGLKCDCCDYRDDEVRFEDYEKYINYPCPKCREPLLTKEDYQKCLRLNLMNKLELGQNQYKYRNILQVQARQTKKNHPADSLDIYLCQFQILTMRVKI